MRQQTKYSEGTIIEEEGMTGKRGKMTESMLFSNIRPDTEKRRKRG